LGFHWDWKTTESTTSAGVRDTSTQRFYSSGGDRNAYLAFLPFDAFGIGFIGYVTKSELGTMIMDKTKNPAES